ncbi:hypothetical protein OGAPHI_006102 [Ogataea philodendri]|uniref:Uncharacterized protein n=1 Tax=Ogataea philodendri TaxID=1378263 RepID=A0A9P8T0M4_9ASCO|nr:uncharacterized protein OGAPHI_006102 [Ogataea philodendri]KAH3661923.1 hypothetical protein OGAPHI_006102 [Ogataea philodendri]
MSRACLTRYRTSIWFARSRATKIWVTSLAGVSKATMKKAVETYAACLVMASSNEIRFQLNLITSFLYSRTASGTLLSSKAVSCKSSSLCLNRSFCSLNHSRSWLPIASTKSTRLANFMYLTFGCCSSTTLLTKTSNFDLTWFLSSGASFKPEKYASQQPWILESNFWLKYVTEWSPNLFRNLAIGNLNGELW